MTANIYGELDLIAELAISLLGFIGVFLVLSNRDGRFAESDRHFIQAIVLTTSLAIVLSLAPRVLRLFVSPDVLWTYALYLGLVGGTAISFVMAKQQLKMTPEEASKIHWGWHAPAWSIAAIITILILGGVFGFVPAVAAYLGALIFTILNAVWCFIAIVFRRFF